MDLQAFTSELLDHIGLSYSRLEVSQLSAGGKFGRTVVAVTTGEPDAAIGPHGEHLRALNSIARRLAEARWGEEGVRFIIDINGYHETKLEEMRQQARMLAQRARLFKRDVELPPQSAYERLVVHELFADDPEIATESAGEGKFRHIVLKYKS